MDAASTHVYSHKIKTADQVRDAIGSRPRLKTAIMCHGTFDVVHPGHIRHMLYAKTKADVLIASLTADQHITKGNLRPYVPEDLRALNLAALEMVDFVIIDRDETPLKNLGLIQPDFFAKGYDYAGSVHPRTQEEMRILDSYGGQLIFTPGDIVYSSSALIGLAPPGIAVEKLTTLMQAEGVTFDDVRGAVATMQGVKVHVAGDTIVDSHTYTNMTGGPSKTPTVVVRFARKVDFTGGAGVVAKHLQAAGAEVTLSTVLGNDACGRFVREDLRSFGVRCLPIVDDTRPTTHKHSFIADGYRLLKVDTVDNRSISDKMAAQIARQLADTATDAVVFSDYRHGLFNRSTIPQLTGAIPTGAFRVADSQVASRWGNILDFEDFDLITPNEREARFALGDQDSVIRPLALELHRRANCKTLILKMGERGVITYRSNSPMDYRAFFVVDSFADRVVDPVGAGDALLAYATLALVATGSVVVATILGNVAAGIECGHDGNVPVTPDLVLDKLRAIEKRARYEE